MNSDWAEKRDWPAQVAFVADQQKSTMRSPEELHALIECLTALGGGHEREVAMLTWVLGESKSECQRKYEDANALFEARLLDAVHLEAKLRETIATQDAEIRRLKSEPDHK